MGQKDWGEQTENYGVFIHHETIFNPAFRKIVHDLKLKGKKILDLGCGVGEQAIILAKEYDCKVLGIDVCKEMIERAKREYSHKNIKYEVKDAKDIRKNNFDAVFLNTILCNIPTKKDVGKIIRNAVDSLRDGGFAIISNPHPAFEDRSFPTKRERSFPWGFNYFKEGQKYLLKLYKTDGSAISVENFHYPLETYFDLMSKNTMKMVNVAEPRPSKKYVEENKIPVYIIMVAQKNEKSGD